jgi:hypothetical protein
VRRIFWLSCLALPQWMVALIDQSHTCENRSDGVPKAILMRVALSIRQTAEGRLLDCRRRTGLIYEEAHLGTGMGAVLAN